MPGIATSTPSSETSPASAPSAEAAASCCSCASAEPADNAVASSNVSQMSGFDMLILLFFSDPIRRRIATMESRPAARRPVTADQSAGSDEHAVLAVPKSAVEELQVQPAYHVSLASLTAPT